MFRAARPEEAIAAFLTKPARVLGTALAWLGRLGTKAVAAVVFVALAIPALSSVLKPFVAEAVFLLLFTAFLRVDMDKLRGHIRRPGLVLAAAAWTSLAVPALFALAFSFGQIETRAPDLHLALALQAITSPLMSSPAFALLMGLDATLVLAVLVTVSAMTPFTAALFAALLGVDLALSPAALGLHLFAIVAGSAALAFVVRRIAGIARIEKRREEIDGVSILLLFVFVSAIMENVGASFVSRPGVMWGLTALAFGVFIAIVAVTFAVFVRSERANALALAFMSAQRNMGLMLAATGGAVPELVWFYVAVAQFPLYLAPYLLAKPVARLLGTKQASNAGSR